MGCNYLGKQLGGWKFSWVEIFRVWIILCWNCPDENYPGWVFSRWELSGWELSWVGIFRVGIFRVVIFRVWVIEGGNFRRWEFSGWELSGGDHPGGNFPGGSFPSTINCFECLFTCPGKKFPFTEELFLYSNIECKYVKRRKSINILYLKKKLKKSDKMKLTLFNTVESNFVPEK